MNALIERFYQSPTGEIARHAIADTLTTLWEGPAIPICGVGYCDPYVKKMKAPMVCLQSDSLPATLCRTIPYVRGGNQIKGRVHESALPLADACLDRLLLIHCLEFTPDPAALLREAWRVLAGEGRVIIVVPNRLGLWARAEDTPFGHGRPYSLMQLQNLLTASMLVCRQHHRILTAPPFESWLAGVGEVVVRRWLRQLAGVIVVEAQKETLFPLRPAPQSSIARLRPLIPTPGRSSP